MFRDRSRTRPHGLFVLLALAGGMALTAPAWAQQNMGPPTPNPRLTVVTPNGAKTGSTVEVVLTGTDLDEAQSLLFSHPGLKAELIAPPAPPMPDPKKPPMPATPAAPPKFKVTVAPDVPLGLHDVRLISKLGISNPRFFAVGDQAEAAEKEPNNDVEQAQRVDLNTTITGAITQPTDVDYFAFTGKKGQRVVVSCLASSLDSRLEAVLEIYDASGRTLAVNRNYEGNDALADITCPADGDYYVRLYQFTHLVGGPEYFYRLTITTAPWIDAVFPQMVEPGKPAQVTIYGRNLPGGQTDPTAVVDSRILEKATVTVTPPSDPMALQRLNFSGYLPPIVSGTDGFEYRVKNPAGASNPVLIGLARAPVVLDNDNNDKAETAQELKVPCEVAGRIEKRRDRDWFKFTAKAGDVYGIEVLSERIGSTSDMQLLIRNPANKQTIAELDDTQETLHQFKFFTRTGDPQRYRFVAPADGTYELFVSSQDADTQAGPRCQYRLSILPEKPDFRLVVMPEENRTPDTCAVGQGGAHMFDVLVWALDGWTGEIQLTMEGLPPGVTCPPVTVGPGVRNAALVVTAAATAAPWAGPIRVIGTATVNGQKVVREARTASIVWAVNPQQPIVTVSRLDRGQVLAVRPSPMFTLTLGQDKATVPQGDKVTIPFKLNRVSPEFKNPLSVNAVGLAPGLNFNNPQNQPITLNPGNDNGSAVLTVAANVAPGTYSVVLRGVGQIQNPMAAGGRRGQGNFTVAAASPPITITVLPKSLATLQLANANPAVQVGKETELVVKVQRQFNFTGEFKVELVLPQGIQGVNAAAVTIPAGKDEAKLILKADAAAQPGNRQGLVARATAMYNNTPVVHEAKFNVNVTK